MKKDKYNEVINHPETYEQIVDDLITNGRCIIGWTDQSGAHLDILFVDTAIQYGELQSGLRGYSDLFVCIMRHSSFGFFIDNKNLFSGYIEEKLMVTGVTKEKLTELINSIKKRLWISKNL